MPPIYLDYNATTPIDPRVAKAMLPFIHEHFGNPSSAHAYGVAPKRAVERARQQVAHLLGCTVDEVVFTSGGSESNNHAIRGVARVYRNRGDHIVTSAIEHPAVSEVCAALEADGYRITVLPVDDDGMVDPRDVAAAITPDTILVTIMHANNEVGTVQPIAEISEIAHRQGVLVHSDCAQSVGKVPVRVDDLGVDLLSIAGHKLYAPKGVGALYVRTGVQLEPLVLGAAQESGARAGTENVVEIVGLGEACAMISGGLDALSREMRATRDRLEAGICERFPDVRVNGHPERRLPNTCSVSFRGQEANTILAELDEVAASAGAACHSDRIDVSAVLQAMRVPVEYAMGTVRFSTGRFTTAQEVDRALEALSAVIGRLSDAATDVAEAVDGTVKLTRFTHGLGCACKLRPQVLEAALARLPVVTDPRVLVGTETADDAAVYLLDDQTAIVQTVDFFTPVVDDPYAFGAIAAANALSDVYAMGAQPLFALNIVGFPSNRLPVSVLDRILRGALDKAAEAGVVVIGGHTVDDTEPKFGMAVTGVTRPDRVITNRDAVAGDDLVLTKPIGTGILSTALKRGLLDPPEEELLQAHMAELNRAAAEAMTEVGVHAATDVTGFGLLGHLLEMMRAADATAAIWAGRVPILPGARERATAGVVPGGSESNLDYTSREVRYGDRVPAVTRLLLNDAQTSGGLLIAVPAELSSDLMMRLRDKGVADAAIIGRVDQPEAVRIAIEP